MKPLHKIASKDDIRPALTYIQVKSGMCAVTNAWALLKIPIKEVFGQIKNLALSTIENPVYDDLIGSDEELYFNAKEWASAKMDKALSIKRDGLIFQAQNKNFSIIGTIVAKSAEQFKKIGKYPDYECVIASPETPLVECTSLGFNPSMLFDLCSAFSCSFGKFAFYFYGEKKPIIVKNADSAAIGLIMPYLDVRHLPHPFINLPETEDIEADLLG